jgi:hypothetical protein
LRWWPKLPIEDIIIAAETIEVVCRHQRSTEWASWSCLFDMYRQIDTCCTEPLRRAKTTKRPSPDISRSLPAGASSKPISHKANQLVILQSDRVGYKFAGADVSSIPDVWFKHLRLIQL